MQDVHCAVLTVGGWFDAEDLAGPLKTFHAINKNRSRRRRTCWWTGRGSHGGWSVGKGRKLGDVEFGSETAEYFRAKIEFPFFEQYLKGESDASCRRRMCLRRGRMCGGSTRLASGGHAGEDALLPCRRAGWLSMRRESEGVDEYVSDPDKPVPFVGYTTDTTCRSEYMEDRTSALRRGGRMCWLRDRAADGRCYGRRAGAGRS